MPSDVRITTNKSPNGSGPKKELKAPGAVPSVVTSAHPFNDAIKPPLPLSTAAITKTIPIIIMIP